MMLLILLVLSPSGMTMTGGLCDGGVAGSEYIGVALDTVTAESDDMACEIPGCKGLSGDDVRRSGADSRASAALKKDVLEVATGCDLGVGRPPKLTLDDRRLLPSLSRYLGRVGDWGAFGSCSERWRVSSMSSSSERVSSSPSDGGLPLVMRNTPKKVNRQPPTNLTARSGVVRSKSR